MFVLLPGRLGFLSKVMFGCEVASGGEIRGVYGFESPRRVEELGAVGEYSIDVCRDGGGARICVDA